MYANERAQRLSRPSGTDGISRSRQPSDESLGYFRMSLRDKGSDMVFVHNTLCHQRPPRLVPLGQAGWGRRLAYDDQGVAEADLFSPVGQVGILASWCLTAQPLSGTAQE